MKPCQHLHGVQRFPHLDQTWRDVCRDCSKVLAQSQPVEIVDGVRYETYSLEPGHPLAGGVPIPDDVIIEAAPDGGIQDI